MPENIFQQLEFHPVTEHWFLDHFKNPSPPQILGWPKIASGQHTLILAPTGSGKTLAAFLWCIDDLFRRGLESNEKDFEQNSAGVHTLYISPLKALNNDIHRNLQEPLKGIRHVAPKLGFEPPHIRAAVRTGDTPSHVRQAMVKKPPHILITTPESLYLLLTSKKGRLIFRKLKYVIVDEIHAVSNNKRGVHLSLSLERLMALLEKEPTRIGLSATQKPLQRIAAFLGGQQYYAKVDKHEPRSVEIVDAGQRKNIDLQVVSPVKDWSDLPEASVWPLVINKLYELITLHKNTLVFVNMRAQSEKIARQLNEKHRAITENPEAELALAHHGSISRELRYETEARLKAGDIPAVIATASLELGIDIGSIDLVVQLQSPGSVSSGLQRIGRSGHLLDSTSKGRIIPLFQADVDDCVALTMAMVNHDIEETHIPENALDVLAQQVVAEVAMRDWSRLDLYRLVRNSYCYRYLSETAFNNVIEMLSGRFGDAELRALQPRITWDRVNDMLIARRGSRLLSVLNGGTIADRGYYGVYLEGANTRLGEVEEEFVFESRVGDIFFLGNNEWRISEITRDRIMVTPRGSTKPRAPFWKGEPVYRDFTSSRKIGAFRDVLLNDKNQHISNATLHSDKDTLDNLRLFLQRQVEHADYIPTDRQIVVEDFRDAVGEPQIIVHAPFGGGVLGAWATALATALEKRFGTEAQFVYDDDGMLFRMLDRDDVPDIRSLLSLSFEQIKTLLVETISQTPMFTVRFRHNATRALLLTRSRTDKRIPLWLQRLRAADLLQVVRDYPNFPILLETYRDCLEDLFDIDSLKIVLEEIHSGETSIQYAHTESPSPMAAGLMFRFLAEHMYDYDRFRTTGYAAEISSELLADILSRQEIPTIVTPELVAKAEQHWQYLSPERQAKDSEDCFEMIDRLGPITQDEIARRSWENPANWLKALEKQNRILQTKAGWISQETKTLYKDHNRAALVRKYVRVHGPQTATEIAEAINIAENQLLAILSELHAEKDIVRGQLVVGTLSEQWCDRDNFALLYRQAIAARRTAHAPGDRTAFVNFQMLWHRVDHSQIALGDIVSQYSGLFFPLHYFEREILPSRLASLQTERLDEQLRDMVAAGDIMPVAAKEEGGRYNVRFNGRGQEHLFRSKKDLRDLAANLHEGTESVHRFLQENGASLFRDIRDGAELMPSQVESALTTLARQGLVTCDHLPSFWAVLQNDSPPTSSSSWQNGIKQPWSTPRRRARRALPRREVQSRLLHRQGRWFLTASFAAFGKEVTPRERVEKQARLLLQRYGILVKEFYRREQGLEPWYHIFQVLKRMEWGGEIRRGYFIEGLSGIQFATNEALHVLEKINSGERQASGTNLLSTIDPALPFGGQLEWGLVDGKDNKISVTRSGSNHIYLDQSMPLLYLENFALRVFTTKASTMEKCKACPEFIKTWLRMPEPIRPRKKIEIAQIDGVAAIEHEFAAIFVENGFEIDGRRLVLWPSNV